jgi:CBS domain-containing protein
MTVRELMSEDVATVEPSTSLKAVAVLLAGRRISGVPVVGPDRSVLGVVSEADIVARERGDGPPRTGILAWLAGETAEEAARLQARTAGEAMSSPAITVGPGSDVSFAARRMTDAGVKRLPVVAGDGRLVGILTRSDLVRAFARSDAALEKEIHKLLRETLWLDEPERVTVDVDDGEVALAGQVDRRSDAELLRLFVPRIPGVIAVESAVTWAWDDREARVYEA